MATIQINGCRYHYDIYGAGPETLFLSHGLLWSGRMFHKQVEHLKDKFRIITYDHRGQGETEVTENGYDMDSLYEDAVELITRLSDPPAHFGGLSMGGFVAMRLAARRPELVKSLILMETSAQDEPNKLKYNLLNTIVKIFGVNSVVNPVMNIMFGQTFLKDPSRKEEKLFWTNELKKNQKTIVRAVSGVIGRQGIVNELQNIQCPTLILVGTEDIATIPEKAAFINSKIPNSQLKHIQHAGHTACVEEPEQYNHEIERFLAGATVTTGQD